jgi:hypothetical protein
MYLLKNLTTRSLVQIKKCTDKMSAHSQKQDYGKSKIRILPLETIQVQSVPHNQLDRS